MNKVTFAPFNYRVLRYFLSLFTLFFLNGVMGQSDALGTLERKSKGDFYIYWGWNLSGYSGSDITFEGNEYHFTIEDVVAHDRQSAFEPAKYLGPTELTKPQYNFRLGYFFKENYSVSFGIDHMKYVVARGQEVTINGEINGTNSLYNGTYNSDRISLDPTFLSFEHTDGLNYINLGLRRHNNLISYKKVELNIVFGIESGVLIPKTNARLLDKQRYDEFHLSGYGINAVAGLQFTFFKHFFVQSEIKGGYINMPDIRTTMDTADSASQSFWFYQVNMVFGARFKL